MDIRTKLVFALVSVALASMLALGVVAYGSAESELRDRRLQQLEGVADLKAAAVRTVVAGWEDRMALVADGSELRVSLSEYERTGGAAPVARIDRILRDAVAVSDLFEALSVFDAAGRFVVGSGGRTPDRSAPLPDHIAFEGVVFGEDDRTRVVWWAPIVVGGEPLGALRAELIASEIEDLSTNYSGLGTTGETLVVSEVDGDVRVLHPVRFPPPGTAASGWSIDEDVGALRALGGDEVRTSGQVTDYRGELVWAATRRVDETGWGVVVKIDESEHVEPIEAVRDNMIQLAITLAAFAIALGTLVGIRFAMPITRLAEAATEIGQGKLDTRTGIDRRDEVGVLAKTLDDMAEALEGQVSLLSEYRRFFDESIDLLCIASTDGYFKRVNAAFIRELGWTEEELLSVPFIERVHPDDRGATEAELDTLASGTPTIRFTNRYECRDGSYKLLRWNAYPEAESDRLYAIARVAAESDS
ncbi:MAG: PAS domain S-box protein [Gemmatimonadota bacterium]